MLLAQALDRREQLIVVLFAQVGYQHHQCPAFLPCQQLRCRGLIVGAALAAVQVINAVEQCVEMADAFYRRKVARLFAGKGTQAHRVALT
ncbi:hypothetical protein D3C85_1583550 [compost metagenome]